MLRGGGEEEGEGEEEEEGLKAKAMNEVNLTAGAPTSAVSCFQSPPPSSYDFHSLTASTYAFMASSLDMPARGCRMVLWRA